MGIQATMTVGNKPSAVLAGVSSGLADYPTFDQVRLVSLVNVADRHRSLEIYNIFRDLINYARDSNIYISAGATAIISSISGTIRTEGLAANVVDGDIAIMMTGSERNKGARNITDNAYQQLLDAMRESGNITTYSAPV